MGPPASPPKDRYNITLCGSFLLGLTVLVPWNFFTMAEEYWKYKFRDGNATDWRDIALNDNQKFFMSYMSFVCNGIFLVVLFLNTFLATKCSSVFRITAALIGVTFTMILTTAFAMIDTDSWQSNFLVVTLVIAGCTSFLVAILSGSSTGICGYLPQRFMASNLLGQSIGGVLCALIQIGCLLVGLSPQRTALLFFSTAVFILIVTSVMWRLMCSADLFRHFRHIASRCDDLSVSDISCMPSGKSQLSTFWRIFLQGWEFHITALIAATASMPIFPGLGNTGVSVHAEDSPAMKKFFLPVACFLTYCVADVFGRYLENYRSYDPSRRKLLVVLSCSRVILIPLLLVCNLNPLERVVTKVLLRSDFAFVLVMILAGFSNGYILNAAFKNGPKAVALEHQETSASIVVCFYATGAVLGSGLSILATMLL